MDSLQDRLSFFVATDVLKETRRANWTWSEPRQETVAEHVWHCTLLAMLLADTAPDGTDHDHVRDLLTIHDLVEVFAGDTVIWDDVPENDVATREERAGERLIGMLPESRRARFDSLWREFQAQETIEARFARAIDALHPMLMSWGPGSQGQLDLSLTSTMALTRKQSVLEAFPQLWEMVQGIVRHAVDCQWISSDEMTPETYGLSQPSDRLAFFFATDALKALSRANWVRSGRRTETVAEHCWHVILLAMLFEDAAPEGIDHNHVRDLLTIHDLVEVFAGDTVLWDDVPLPEVDAREQAAGERLMAMLSGAPRERFDPLWREFQAQETAEARFARAIDSIHPVLVSWSLRGKGHQNTTLTPTRIIERKRPFIQGFPDLWDLTLWIVQEAVNEGLMPEDEMMQKAEDPHHART
ncbi:MAG TPA: HD domain-containing protein [Thermomicrobiales bacterium]|nr:HD domain-containing protein [Thermomicrobiales bacterium]